MLFKQFEAKGLSHYSYAIGSKEEGAIIVIDPERDVKTYIEYAAENRVKIKYIIETHIHADYASGARELAKRSGAEIFVSGYDGGEKYEYGFPHNDLKEGDALTVGSIRLEVLHTPGHTPEHISFLAFDREAEDPQQPVALFSGDFLFIGSVGRPDLLGEDNKTALAKQLYNSVNTKLKGLPDSLTVYPAHGAGTLCGAGLCPGSSTTLGQERATNPWLKPMDEETFVKGILSHKTPFPDYYLRMKRINSEGPELLEGRPKPQPILAEEFVGLVDSGAVIVDLRHPLAFGGAHIINSLNLGMPEQIGFWGAWFLDYEKPVYLVIDEEDKVRTYWQQFVRVGLDNVVGYLKPSFNAWANRGNDFSDLAQASVHMLNDMMELGEDLVIIDVRSEGEWNNCHIQGAKHIYLGELPKAKKSLPADKSKTIFCICGGGSRSSIAGSWLMQQGYEYVYNVFGGMSAWNGAGLPVAKSKETVLA